MTNTIRWLLALPAAMLTYFLSWLAIALIFYGRAAEAYASSVIWSTAIAIMAGAYVAPRPHWQIAARFLSVLGVLWPVALSAWNLLAAGNLSFWNLIDIAGAGVGVWIALTLLHRRLAIKAIPGTQ